MKNTNKKIKRKEDFRQNKKCKNNRIAKLIVDAQMYYDQKQLQQANYLYQQVLQLEPENIVALNGLGLIAMQAGMLSLAVEFLTAANEINPEHLAINKNLALAYTRLSRFNEAILQYICILDIDENNTEAHAELARLNLQAGHLDLALHHYRYAFELNPEDPENFHGIVQLDSESLTAADIDTVENILNKWDLALEKRSSFYYSLGNVYDACGRYDEAFANYSVANIGIGKGITFDAEKHAAYVTDIIHTYSSGLFKKYTGRDLNQSNQPVFIVGMPRSGTTLVEQILASHSDIFAAGELSLIEDISRKIDIDDDHDFFKPVKDNSKESLKKIAQFYLNSINNLAINNAQKNPLIISNKQPANFIHLGLIALLFPNARIIHCKRNPLDVCLSCYFQNFSVDHDYAFDLKAVAKYYQQYERLMAHWKKVLPIEIHTVNYEEMVKNTESTSKTLIEFIGLDWQEGCREFYKTKRQVNTASQVQVRKNIYHSSLNRWLHYEKYLHLLKKTLNIFDYADETIKLTKINPQKLKNDEKIVKYLH